MTPPNRREEEVRRLLDTAHPQVPADLAQRAAAHGRRVLRRRRVAHRVLWVLLVAVLTTAMLFAALAWPDQQQPHAPTLEDW